MSILPAITIQPTTYRGHPAFLVGRGVHGTGVVVRSLVTAHTIQQVLEDEAIGALTPEERWDIITALVQDDALDAGKAGRS
jgi:hypothetical protein